MWRIGIGNLLCCLCAVAMGSPGCSNRVAPGQRQQATTGQCFDDDLLPHDWGDHGDPIDPGVPPGNGSSNDFYYYLSANMCGTRAHARIWTSTGRWRVTIYNGFDKTNPLADQTADAPFEVTAPVTAGQLIRARFANVGSDQAPDHSSLYSDSSCALIGNPTDLAPVATGTGCQAAPSAPGGSLVWPNSSSSANSDDWIAAHHDAITEMRPRILALNFTNTLNGQANAPQTVTNMVNIVSNLTCNGAACSVIDGLKLGSKYHGYADATAPAFLSPQLAYAVDLSDNGAPPSGWLHNNSSKYPIKCTAGDDHQFDFGALFSAKFAAYYNIHDSQGNLLNLTQLIQRGLVHEVYLFVDGDDALPDQLNTCSADSQCSTGRVCRGGFCRTSDAYQCPNGVHMSDFQLPEVLEWKQMYDANNQKLRAANGQLQFDPSAGNGTFDTDELAALQPLGRSIRFVYVNSTRGSGCALHSMGHAIEHSTNALPALGANFAHFANFDLDRRGFSPKPPFSNWYGLQCSAPPCISFASSNSVNWLFSPTGVRGTLSPFNQGCGSVHFPPNATQDYDDQNSTSVLASCASFGLHDGTGGRDAQTLINNAAWHNQNGAQAVSYDDAAPDCEGGWQIYWRQSFPGYGNHATGSNGDGSSNGKPIESWWPYLYY